MSDEERPKREKKANSCETLYFTTSGIAIYELFKLWLQEPIADVEGKGLCVLLAVVNIWGLVVKIKSLLEKE